MGRSKHSGEERMEEQPGTYQKGPGDEAGAVGRAIKTLDSRKQQIACQEQGKKYNAETGKCE